MSESRQSSEKEAGVTHLRDYEQELVALMDVLTSTGEEADVREMYRVLKEGLKADQDRLRWRRMRAESTHVEDAFLRPVVMRALAALKPATNSDPITSRWLDAVYNAHVEISHMRHELEAAS